MKILAKATANGVLSFYHGGVEAIRVWRSDIDARIAELKTGKRRFKGGM